MEYEQKTKEEEIEELRREMGEIKSLLKEVLGTRSSDKETQPKQRSARPRNFTFREIQDADRVYSAPSSNKQSKASSSRGSAEHNLQQRVRPPKKKEP